MKHCKAVLFSFLGTKKREGAYRNRVKNKGGAER
jgi:hypothetical protein